MERTFPARLRLLRLLFSTGLAAAVLAGCGVSGLGRRTIGPAPSSIADGGETLAEIELGARLVSGRGIRKDTAAGAAVIERAAENGNAAAQVIIGQYYLSGIGVERKPEVAASWLQKAAAQNLAPAQAELAFYYLRGIGVAQDYGRGMQLAKSAADRGAVEGYDALGQIYANGWGVNADTREALRWSRKAADRKYWRAMLHLGELYRDGKGVPADDVVAVAWFDLAVVNAPVDFTKAVAAKARDDAALLLLPSDLALARQLAAEWQPGGDPATRRDTIASPAAAADAPSPPTARVAQQPDMATRAADLPIVMKLLTYDYDVRADGSFVRSLHTELQPRNEAAVTDVAQQPLRYMESREKVEVLEAYTLKPDGRKLPVNPASIQTQTPPGAPNVPMFDDQRQKVIIFPAAEAGDLLVATAELTAQPLIPGLFNLSMPFDRTLPYDEVRVTVSAPKSMPLVTETHEMTFEKRSEGDKIVYEWRYANTNPLPEKIQALDDRDVAPRLFASSYQSYDELARAYGAFSDEKGAVTPAIRKLADEVTAGVADRRKQTELIYGWVSRHIRYVAVELGQEALVPHPADMVLSNGYGDCKDHAILFSALLKAKGIASHTALINLGTSYALANAPTLGSLNHAITWLPDFNLYVDTTAAVAPFGVLPFEEYGKPVVLAGAAAPAVRRTPNLPVNSASITFKTAARLDKDGGIEGDSETTASGAFSVSLRQDAVSIQAAGQEQTARNFLRSKGYEGTGRFDFASPFEASATYRVAGHFQLNRRPEVFSGNSFYLPTGLDVGARPGEFLMGMLAFRDARGSEPTPCFSGRQEEELSLELPEGKTLRELPTGSTVSNKYMHYKSEWSLTGRTVMVRREFSSAVDQPVCIGEVRRAAAEALAQIRADYNKPVALAPD
jgi:transglutaminase-like putative cysteine protease